MANEFSIKKSVDKKQSMKLQSSWKSQLPIVRGNGGVVYRVSMLALAIAMDLIGSKPFE